MQVKRELLALALLLLFGIAILPALIFVVGIVAIGPYEGDGIASLYAAILTGLAAPEVAPWLLVTSPWIFVQLIRLLVALRKPRGAVKPVTK